MPKFPTPSPHAALLSAQVFSALADKARAREGTVHPLHVGDTYLEPSITELSPEARQFTYAPVQGEPALLEVVHRRLSARARVDADDIQIMSGATAGLSVVCSTILTPGDEVIVLAPYWPLIAGIVRLRGARAIELPFYDRLGHSDFDPERAVTDAITERTVAIYVNTPNNPTGAVLASDVLDVLAKVARQHELWVLSDEAYDELWYGGEPPPAVWTHPGLVGRVIASHTLSKSHAMAGARVGFSHGPNAVMRAVRGVQTFSTYCAPRPMQKLAARVLASDAEFLTRARTAYAAAGRRAAQVLGVPAPAGGTFLFFDASRFLQADEGIEVFLERCLDAGVLLTPGAASGQSYSRWARLCFTSVPPDQLDDALYRLARVLS